MVSYVIISLKDGRQISRWRPVDDSMQSDHPGVFNIGDHLRFSFTITPELHGLLKRRLPERVSPYMEKHPDFYECTFEPRFTILDKEHMLLHLPEKDEMMEGGLIIYIQADSELEEEGTIYLLDGRMQEWTETLRGQPMLPLELGQSGGEGVNPR